jgi:hypothetical protein
MGRRLKVARYGVADWEAPDELPWKSALKIVAVTVVVAVIARACRSLRQRIDQRAPLTQFGLPTI